MQSCEKTNPYTWHLSKSQLANVAVKMERGEADILFAQQSNEVSKNH